MHHIKTYRKYNFKENAFYLNWPEVGWARRFFQLPTQDIWFLITFEARRLTMGAGLLSMINLCETGPSFTVSCIFHDPYKIWCTLQRSRQENTLLTQFAYRDVTGKLSHMQMNQSHLKPILIMGSDYFQWSQIVINLSEMGPSFTASCVFHSPLW